MTSRRNNNNFNHKLTIACWNIRTLQDNPKSNKPERRTALIATELDKLSIDIAAISETRFPDTGQLTEIKSGYTYFWSGRKPNEKRESGVGFVIRSSLLSLIETPPIGFSDRIISTRLKLKCNKFLTVVSIYAPTMSHTSDSKDKFYTNLRSVLDKIPLTDKLLLMGDFNARVGRDADIWAGVIGKHGTGKCNSNGRRLLALCQSYGLVITNTVFQLPDKYKNTWMHQRSKHWHLIDYIITRQTDVKDVIITRVMRGAICDTDHRLVRSKLKLQFRRIDKRPKNVRPRINVDSLKDITVHAKFVEAMNHNLNKTFNTQNVQQQWVELSKEIYDTSIDVLGNTKKKNEDWFDDNVDEIKTLIKTRNDAELNWLSNKTNANKIKMLQERRNQRVKIREIKNRWWCHKSQELQQHADCYNMKAFYQSLNKIYGPRRKSLNPLRSKDNNKLLSETDELLARWREHFSDLLNTSYPRDDTVINALPQYTIMEDLDDPPTRYEIEAAIRRLNNGKSPGADGIPCEILKHGGSALVDNITSLIQNIWELGEVPQEFKDAVVLPLYKNKGDKSSCDNYRGISLLSSAGKVLSNILNTRLTVISEYHNPESQAGFRKNRGCNDMIFALRQLQEKCIEQNQPLYICFVDFCKAFDTVPRGILWKILEKFGCPPKLLHLTKELHNNMNACVNVNGQNSSNFPVSIGTRQGCILAPTLFNIFLIAVLSVAFCDYTGGVHFRFRTDGGLHKLSRFSAKTKVTQGVFQQAIYADDCAFVSCNPDDLQDAITRLATTSSRFGLKINLQKTEIMASTTEDLPEFFIDDVSLEYNSRFKYLGSFLSQDANLDLEIDSRISTAARAFSALRKRVWQNHDLQLQTKLGVYRAVIIPSLMYASETWTPYRRHIRRLDKFHQKCLRSIMNIKWQDHVSNVTVLNQAQIFSIEALLIKYQLRWTGHVLRMSDERLPKQLLYSELQDGRRNIGAPRKRFKDSLKTNINNIGLSNTNWEECAQRRPEWRRSVQDGVEEYERRRQEAQKTKASARKNRPLAGTGDFLCDVCGKLFLSRIGLSSHLRAHIRRNLMDL